MGYTARIVICDVLVKDAACGDGLDVEVIPSAAQMNRDMPIVNKKGTQIWPKP